MTSLPSGVSLWSLKNLCYLTDWPQPKEKDCQLHNRSKSDTDIKKRCTYASILNYNDECKDGYTWQYDDLEATLTCTPEDRENPKINYYCKFY